MQVSFSPLFHYNTWQAVWQHKKVPIIAERIEIKVTFMKHGVGVLRMFPNFHQDLGMIVFLSLHINKLELREDK